jgi:hypothetical protein
MGFDIMLRPHPVASTLENFLKDLGRDADVALHAQQ